MAATILRQDLNQKRTELITKYNTLVLNIEKLDRERTSMNNEALMTKGAIQVIDEQLAKLDEKDEEIMKAGKDTPEDGDIKNGN